MFVALVAYFFLVVAPRQEATRQDARHAAEAFARLTGGERRLAIYDAFAAEISAHYYGQSFVGSTGRSSDDTGVSRLRRVPTTGISTGT
jgi:hypothetical protein